MIYISLGSNLGNRLQNLQAAVELLKSRCLKNIETSIVLETEAILPDQAQVNSLQVHSTISNSPQFNSAQSDSEKSNDKNSAKSDWDKPYLNMIIRGYTDLTPDRLLDCLKEIERDMGRPTEYEKWSPRIIDLDILYFNNEIIDQPNLKVPHPEIPNRDFLTHLLTLMDKAPNHNLSSNTPFMNYYVLFPKIVGIINITEDSFSDGGKYFSTEDAFTQLIELHKNGASVIEIGAQSTRPVTIPATKGLRNWAAQFKSIEEEYKSLVNFLERAADYIKSEKIILSIDTFHPKIALDLISKFNIGIINDVMGSFDDETLKKIAEQGTQYCLMHSLTIPPNREDIIPKELDTTKFILDWSRSNITRLKNLGFSSDQIIIDPGIGFGKDPYQNITLLRNLLKLKYSTNDYEGNFSCKIMLGHSRKSFISAFSNSTTPADRDIETISLSLALSDNIDYLRVHNVKDQMKALTAFKIIN